MFVVSCPTGGFTLSEALPTELHVKRGFQGNPLPKIDGLAADIKSFILNGGQATEQLKFHPFRSHRAIQYLTNHI